MTDPINLGLSAPTGDLELSFIQIAYMMDNNNFVEAVRRGGIAELYGPAFRAPRQNELKVVKRTAAARS